MKLHQLRCLCEVADAGLSISRAAAKLHTSPAGISKQVKLLEDQLGATLLVRKNTRITGLTETGQAVLPTFRRVLKDVENARRIAHEVSGHGKGELMIATTHTHASYALVPMIKRFMHDYPNVGLYLRQAPPAQISQLVASGEVDIGIATAPIDIAPGLIQIPSYELQYSIITPRNHPLLRTRRPALEAISEYPFITSNPASRLGRLVRESFAAKGLTCNVVISALDTNVAKTYVRLGFGIAVLPTIAVDIRQDAALCAIPAGHLFKPARACIVMVEGQELPAYARSFVAMVAQAGGRSGGRSPTQRGRTRRGNGDVPEFVTRIR